MTLFQREESRIFKDSSWLQPLSDPPNEKPLCREAALEYMASFLSGLFKTGQARNLFVFGKPGTGKTLCVQYLLREIRKHAKKEAVPLAAVYVNAGKTRTPYYTALEIVRGLGLEVPQSGWQMFRLKQAFEKTIKDMAVIVAIDEVEILLLKEKEPLVYYLNRQPKTTLILVSNRIEDAAELPDRALSTLRPKLLRLEPYTPEEAKTILKQRVSKALQPGVLPDGLLEMIAEAASKAGDIRLGFGIILSAGRIAEDKGKNTIEFEDLRKAAESEAKPQLLKRLVAKQRALERIGKKRR